MGRNKAPRRKVRPGTRLNQAVSAIKLRAATPPAMLAQSLHKPLSAHGESEVRHGIQELINMAVKAAWLLGIFLIAQLIGWSAHQFEQNGMAHWKVEALEWVDDLLVVVDIVIFVLYVVFTAFQHIKGIVTK